MSEKDLKSKLKRMITPCINKRTPLQQLMAGIAGGGLFFLLGFFVSIRTGIFETFVFLQYPVLCLVGAWAGPAAGLLMGGLGYLAVDLLNGGGLSVSWALGSALVGLFCGLYGGRVKLHIHHLPEADSKAYTFLCVIGQLIVWWLIAPLLDMLIDGESLSMAFRRGFFSGLSNSLTSLLVGVIILGTGNRTRYAKLISVVVLIDALLLLSWGRHGIGNFAVYLLAVGMCCYVLFSDFIKKHSHHGIGYVIRMTVTIGLALFVLLIGFLGLSGYANQATGNEEVIIVLGAGLDGDQPTPILKNRLDAAYDFATEHPDTVIITCGGQGKDEIMPEAEAMKNYLTARGIDESRILTDTESATTEENFARAREMVLQAGYGEDVRIAYATSNYHCFRSGVIARQAGFGSPRAIPAAVSVWSLLPCLIRESLSAMKLVLKTMILGNQVV